MQGVNVLGVSNPMQFPDDMDKDDIREFLRKRFAKQAVEGTQPVDLAPLQGQARAIEQSLAEKAGQGISNALYDSGIISDRYGAQRIGENVTSIGEFLPVIGDATAGDEFGRALKQGDGVGMALGALGAIPLVGDTAKKLSKIVDIERLKYDKLMTPLKAEFKLASAPRKEEIKIAAAELRKPLDAANSKLTIEKIRSRPKVKAAVEDVKPNKTFTGKGFHQTSSKFDEFDLNKSADGTAWFTNDINNFSDPASSSAAARGKGSIMERDIVLNKAAGYEELDKYSIGELKDQGYDGAILGGEIQVFDPKAIKTPSTNKAMGALGAIPLVGDAAKKGAKKAGKWYHGTTKDFDKFNTETTFITDNEGLAKIYAKDGRDSASRVFEVEHDVPDELIFDTSKPEHKALFDSEFYRKWGGGGPLSDKGYPDWTDAEDFKDFFNENNLPFKAVRIQEPQGDISLAITDSGMVRPKP